MTTKTLSPTHCLLEAKLAKTKADERKQRTRRLIEMGAMEPLGERVAALTAERTEIFHQSSAGQLGSLDGNKGNNQHQGVRKQCLVRRKPPFFVMRDFGLPTPKSGYGFPQPGKAPLRGWGGVRLLLPGPQERSADMVPMPT
jgi:hypothetical protein